MRQRDTWLRRLCGDRGAEAVEFALIVPVLLVIVFGAIEFGRLYNEQIQLTGAARSAARVMAIGNDASAATTAAVSAAPALNPGLSSSNVAIAPAKCVAGATVTVTVSYSAPLLTGMWGPSMNLTGTAVMPCGG